jgi:acyl-CoA synthetase (AMP-forming)/AMP-acid ligase II
MIGALLSANAVRYPNSTAVVFGKKQFSYFELNARACRLANALAASGVSRGDRVASLMNNCHQYIELLFAAAKLGAIYVPVNFRLAPREVKLILDGCRPSILFVGDSVRSTVDAISFDGAMPMALRRVLDRPSDSDPIADDPYEAWIGSSNAQEPDLPVHPDDVLFLLHSSGTTGLPKAAIWTNSTTLCSSTAKLIDFALTNEDITAVFGPLFHAGPLLDLAVPLLLRGGKLIIGATTAFDPNSVIAMLARERVTVVTIYPTMWRRVLALDTIEDHDLTGLRLLLTGGEPIPVPVVRQIHRRFPGAGFINTYGSTEGGPITTCLLPADGARKIGSVGRPAFSVEVRIADNAMQPLGPGMIGELLVRSPFVCKGYWNQPVVTQAQLSESWWRTGDLALRDAEGFIYITGRKKDMIISGAENIYPAEVEKVIAEIDGVVEVAVVGVPDPEWGEAVAAFIVKTPETALDAAMVIEHCRRNLASYKKPRHVRFIDAVPRTTVSKISKDTLRAQWAAEQT